MLDISIIFSLFFLIHTLVQYMHLEYTSYGQGIGFVEIMVTE